MSKNIYVCFAFCVFYDKHSELNHMISFHSVLLEQENGIDWIILLLYTVTGQNINVSLISLLYVHVTC